MEIHQKATMYWLKVYFKAYPKGCALEKMAVFSNKPKSVIRPLNGSFF